MYGLCRRHLLNRLERGTGQRSAGSVLEAGAEVKVARFLNDFDGRGTEESSWLLSAIDRALGFLSSTTWIATVTLPGRLRDPLI